MAPCSLVMRDHVNCYFGRIVYVEDQMDSRRWFQALPNVGEAVVDEVVAIPGAQCPKWNRHRAEVAPEHDGRLIDRVSTEFPQRRLPALRTVRHAGEEIFANVPLQGLAARANDRTYFTRRRLVRLLKTGQILNSISFTRVD